MYQVTFSEQSMRELNRLGLSGVIDPGGFNMSPEAYQPLFRVWRDGNLTVRVSYSLFAQKNGKELEEFKELAQMTPMGFASNNAGGIVRAGHGVAGQTLEIGAGVTLLGRCVVGAVVRRTSLPDPSSARR